MTYRALLSYLSNLPVEQLDNTAMVFVPLPERTWLMPIAVVERAETAMKQYPKLLEQFTPDQPILLTVKPMRFD